MWVFACVFVSAPLIPLVVFVKRSMEFSVSVFACGFVSAPLMPLVAFEKQGRIEKSTAAWRKKVLGQILLEYDPKKHKVVFISHTWWDRDFKDDAQLAEAARRVKAGEEPDKYDRGAPDWQSGDEKDLKHRVIVAGMRSLIKAKGWDESVVCV